MTTGTERTLSEPKTCKWAPIEPESSTYQPGCCNEWWNLEDNCELYPYCHWCGGKIEEVEAESDEPPEPDGEAYRSGEYASAPAEEQAEARKLK